MYVEASMGEIVTNSLRDCNKECIALTNRNPAGIGGFPKFEHWESCHLIDSFPDLDAWKDNQQGGQTGKDIKA